MKWLSPILNDAYLLADVEARRAETWQEAFGRASERVSVMIPVNFVASLRSRGGDELQRLKEMISTAVAYDPFTHMFGALARTQGMCIATWACRAARQSLTLSG